MSEINLDKWADRYAARTSSMQASEVRTLFAATARTDIISFAGGLPDTRLFPTKNLLDATKKVVQSSGVAALQYGTSDGYLGLKQCIIKMLSEDGIDAATDDLIITDGAQQAIEFLGKIFIDPGDPIIIESPSFVGAIQAFKGYQPDIIEVELDENGISTEKLESALKSLKEVGQRAKFIYVISNFHNPAGVTLSLERRKKLISLSKEYDVLIVEDDPYGRVRFEGESLPSLRSMDENVIYLGTFSKIFAPGIRLGYVVAPQPILEKLNLAKQAANLCSSSFTQRLTEEVLKKGTIGKYVSRTAKIYRERRDVMLDSLDEHFPSEARFNIPQGGLFLWVELPDFIDTKALLAESLREAKVTFVPGYAFYAKGTPQNAMRLNFSYADNEGIREGMKRLGKVIKYQMDLYSSLTKGL